MNPLLQHELKFAVALARQAGAAVMNFYETAFVVEEKIGFDNFAEPVTAADRAASRIIVDALQAEFPADGILSEEETDDDARLTRNRVWIIDPIDGTNGFIGRQGDFAVQIGLAINHETILGVVYEPSSDKLFWAAKGAGAWLESSNSEPQKLQVSDETDFRAMILAASRSHRSPRMNQVVETFGFKREIKRGSVGVKVGLLATRQADVYIHLSPQTKQWDTCAPQIILEEAGGIMTDLFGAKIIYNTADVQNHNGVVSTNGATHQAVIEKLKTMMTGFGRRQVN